MAIEVGGTFTDLIWIDEERSVRTHKVPSTPGDPSVGVSRGLTQALGAQIANLARLVHGSTVATNAVLERKGCKAALVTTEGFRDLLALQRQLRPNVYAVECRKPQPLIPLARTIEAAERLDAAGAVTTPLDEAAFSAALDRLMREHAPEALAICLLHAYRNPVHERRLRDIVGERHPELPVVLSSDVLPTFREYERASTTAMAAYLAPVVGRYLAKMEDHLATESPRAGLFVMQSSGGVLPSHAARDRSVDMLNSGPAGGVLAAVRISALIGDRDIITLDVGGTSADVCLIVDGRPEVSSQSEVDGLPVGIPTTDIANVGAGGGSIGWIDRGGMLQVGPRSAGARPGPACYGHGGEAPALTDALVHLGWLRPERFLGGRMRLLPERADAALATIAGPLRQGVAQTAQAMVDIGVAHISNCVRLVSVQRGYDPKGYALYGYGGMGPMLSALVAHELEMPRVVIPPHPGLFSALGLLVADLKRIYRETEFLPVDSDAPARIASVFDRIETEAVREFEDYGHRRDQIEWEHHLEMRYRGQGFELLAPVEPSRLRSAGARYLVELFRSTHIARYGTAPANDAVEIVTFRVVAKVPGSREAIDQLRRACGQREPELQDGRILWQGEPVPCRFAARETLPVGFAIDGPVVVEEATATTLVPPGWHATVVEAGALVLEQR